MPMTVDQVVTEARQWPVEQVAELMDRLAGDLPATAEVEAAWKTEIRRRVAEIQTGKVQGVPGEAVAERVREIVGR